MMAVLPMLLQGSLLFFGVGLLRAVQSEKDSCLDKVGVFLILGLVFYAFTLIYGVVFPRCPFKTAMTEYLILFETFVLLKPIQIAVYILYSLPSLPFIKQPIDITLSTEPGASTPTQTPGLLTM